MIEAKARRWGNSVGFVIPNDVAKKEKIKPGQKFALLVLKEPNVLMETFGSLRGKFKKSTQEILDQTDRELYGD